MTATEKLAELDAKAEEAGRRYQVALSAKRHGRGADAGTEALAPVQQYYRDVEARRRDPDFDDLRKLTAEACERIMDDGLIFIIPVPGRIHVTDPEVEIEVATALQAQTDAMLERDEFKRESRGERESERNRAEAEAIKEAMESGDADRIREVLNPSGSGPLTTAYLGAGDAGTVKREKTGTVFHVVI